MIDQMEDRYNGKSQAVEGSEYKEKERPRENSRTGRPDINEISKRNEAIANQERKTFYKVAGIIVLLIIAIIFLLYFFS